MTTVTDQHTLPAPFAPPEPMRVDVDISIEPWTEGATLGDAGRFPMSVPREVAAHVHRVKNLAAQMVAQELDFTHVLGDMREQTARPRQELARLDAERQQAQAAGATSSQLNGIDGLQLAARHQMLALLQAGVVRVVGPVREQLAKVEREAMTDLTHGPGAQPTEADYSAANELSATLDVVPPGLAAPLLLQRLILDPAKTAKLGLTAAALPLLRGRVGKAELWQTPEIEDVLRLGEVLMRDQHWHRAHLRLRTAQATRFKVDGLAADYVAARGDGSTATNPFYADLGAVAPPEA
jgi:hypothetical protein